MKVCDTDHQPVAFLTPQCPVCLKAKTIKLREKELALKDEKIYELEGKVADLDYKLEECEKEL